MSGLPASPGPARGYAIALASALFFSTTALFIRHLTVAYHLPPLVLALWRDVFVVLALVPCLATLRPSLLGARRDHLPYLVLYGLVLAVFNSFLTLSVALNGAAVSTVLVYSSAGFTALLGWRLLGESIGLAKLGAIALSLGGCALVSGAVGAGAWRTSPGGLLTGLLSGLGYAAYSLMGRSASQRGLDPWTTLLYTFGAATGWLLLLNLVPGGIVPGAAERPLDLLWLGDSLSGWGLLILLAAGPTLAGFGLYNVSLSHLPSSVANLIVTTETLFTALTAYLLLGERMSRGQMAGGLMILSGVVLLRISDLRARPGRPGGRAAYPPSLSAAAASMRPTNQQERARKTTP